MKIAVLTSSRADYGIYRPLLELLEADDFFDLRIIAFGTHLYESYGKTIEQIKKDAYRIDAEIKCMPLGDSPADVAKAMGETMSEFSKVWEKTEYDIILALGDRFEMFGAVAAALPFNKKIAHIHGGETTLGAIDNAFRHSISLMSDLHLVSAEAYKTRITEIIGSSKNVYNVGALSIDSIKQITLLSQTEFRAKFGIDIRKPSILITFHPETVGFEKNEQYINEIVKALNALSGYQFIITMPNADTKGLIIREHLMQFIEENENAVGVESFGSQGYLTAMKHCALMLGNTSSGFIEAAGFNKPVVNLGKRQKGRILTQNIFNAEINKTEILKAVQRAEKYDNRKNITVYGDGSAAQKILRILKTYANE